MDLMSPNDYLNLFKLSNNRYIIGIFQRGVSIVKQQTRALNIFNSLIKKKIIGNNPDYKICVIGGGVAGVTFASAALKTGNTVYLIESNASLLHFQKECCTRQLHPNIYEWPKIGTLFPHAPLPLLSWRKNSADKVAIEIENQFNSIRNEVLDIDDERSVVLTNTKVSSVESFRGKLQVKYKSKTKNTSNVFDLVIYAVGFGFEKGENQSYWRNDSYAQTAFNGPSKYLVSGVGDGGLIDVFRLKISEFSYDSFLNIMKTNDRKYEKLINKLREIKEDTLTTDYSPADLYHAFLSTSKLSSYIVDELKKDESIIRLNTVILNGETPFQEILDLKSVSFINAFIIFLLYDNIFIDYKKGKLVKDGNVYRIENENCVPEVIPQDVEIIERHGTRKSEIIDSLVEIGETEKSLKEIEGLQNKILNRGDVNPQWSYSDLFRLLNKSKTPENRRVEFISPRIVEFFSMKMKRLFGEINALKEGKDEFMLTIYKLKFLENKPFVQQITPYFVNKSNGDCHQDHVSTGQIFSLTSGAVGFSVRRQEATLTKRYNSDDFDDLVKNLHLNPGFASYNRSESYFTIPILAKIGSEHITSLIIFVEAKRIDFFDNILEFIRNYSIGIIKDLNNIEITNYNILDEDEFKTIPVEVKEKLPTDLDVISNPCWMNLKGINKTIKSEYILKYNSLEDM